MFYEGQARAPIAGDDATLSRPKICTLTSLTMATEEILQSVARPRS